MNDCQTCGDEVPIVALLCDDCRPHSFDELSDEAKQHARNEYRSGDYPGYDWWDFAFDDAVRMAGILGIVIDTTPKRGPDIYFSGFCSQGDGASFDGRLRYAPDATKKIREETNDEELIRIADELTTLQMTTRLLGHEPFKAEVDCSRGDYCHSGCMGIELHYDEQVDELPEHLERDVLQLMRDFADWIYNQLEAEYDYLCSDEYVDERLQDEEFDEDGNVI